MNNLTVLDGSLALHCSATGSQDCKLCSGENQFSEITLWTQHSPSASPPTSHLTPRTRFHFQLRQKTLCSWPEEIRDFEVGQKVEEHC